MNFAQFPCEPTTLYSIQHAHSAVRPTQYRIITLWSSHIPSMVTATKLVNSNLANEANLSPSCNLYYVSLLSPLLLLSSFLLPQVDDDSKHQYTAESARHEEWRPLSRHWSEEHRGVSNLDIEWYPCMNIIKDLDSVMSDCTRWSSSRNEYH